MSLDDIYMPPIRIDTSRLVSVTPLGEWPAVPVMSQAQLEQRRAARLKQVGKPRRRVKR